MDGTRMRRAAWIAATLGLLSGCHQDDDGGNPEILSGMLRAGGPQGVSYQTLTQSGTTDSSGGFTYVAGEEVTFAVGSVRLGTVRGAPEITLFQLAGGVPPSSELAVRRELNRAITQSTPFSKATNLARFLLALDADGDPSNGLDVRNRATTFADSSVDFEVRLVEFAEQLRNLAPRLNNNIPVSKAVIELYRGAGVVVRGNFASRQYRDDDSDGIEESVIRGVYSQTGIHQLTEYDEGVDGTIDASTSFEHDAMGRITQLVTTAPSGTPLASTRYSITSEFDVLGNLVAQVAIQEGPPPLFPLENRLAATFDEYGRKLTTVWDTRGPDGSLVMRDSQSFELDGRGNTTRIVTSQVASWGVGYEIAEENTFDSADRLLTTTVSYGYGVDGEMELRRSMQFEYDSLGQLVLRVVRSDSDGNGEMDELERASLFYDASGNLERELVETEGPVAGVVTSRRDRRQSFDSDRRVLSDSTAVDVDADGVLDQQYDYSFTYDSLGLLTSRVAIFRDLINNAGTASRYELGYDANGAPLWELYALDDDGDGDVDIRSTSRIEYEFHEEVLPRIVNGYVGGLNQIGGAVSVGAY